MGIRRPGFELLSLSNEAHTNAHHSCLLPDQVRVYCWVYAPLLFATIVFVAARVAIAAPVRHQKHAMKRSFELPKYRVLSLQPPPPPARRQGYLLQVKEDLWAVARLPLTVYMIIAVTMYW